MDELPATFRLDRIEARVLGVLIEKALTTPEQYPLTLNAVHLGCNQKSAREPVLELEPGEVGHALRTLEDKKLVRVVHGARALRYEHRADEVYTITPQQRALLCLLLLRGPQTPGELSTRSDRLARFADLAEVKHTLERMCTRTPPLAVDLGRAPGQREDRYAHLLSGPVGTPAADTAPRAAGSEDHDRAELAARVAELEQRVARLEAQLALAGSTPPPHPAN